MHAVTQIGKCSPRSILPGKRLKSIQTSLRPEQPPRYRYKSKCDTMMDTNWVAYMIVGKTLEQEGVIDWDAQALAGAKPIPL